MHYDCLILLMSKQTIIVFAILKHYPYIYRSAAVLPISPIVSIQVPVPFNTTENNPIAVTFTVVSIFTW